MIASDHLVELQRMTIDKQKYDDLIEEIGLLLRCPEPFSTDTLKCRISAIGAISKWAWTFPYAIKHVISRAWMCFLLWQSVADFSQDVVEKSMLKCKNTMYEDCNWSDVHRFWTELMWWIKSNDGLTHGADRSVVVTVVQNAISNLILLNNIVPDMERPFHDIDAFDRMLFSLNGVIKEIAGLPGSTWLKSPNEFRVFDDNKEVV